MPAYNAERFIAASIESVLKQKGISFELIIYDDGSTDRTFAIAQTYSKDARVRVFRARQNRGTPRTHNAILSHARGKYIAPHDADDIMLAGRLAEGARVMDRRPKVGVVLGNAILLKRDRKQILGLASPLGNRWARFRRRSRLLRSFPWSTLHGGVMFRGAILRAAGGYNPNLKCVHDADLLMRLWSRTRFYFVDRCFYVYRLQSGSLTDRLVRWDGAAKALTRETINPFRNRKGVSIQLPGLKIRVLSENAQVLRLLRKNLCCPVQPWDVAEGFGPSDVLLNVRHKSPQTFYYNSDLETCALRRWWESGIGYSFAARHAETLVLLKTGRSFPENQLYHNAFLFPLFFLLLRRGAALVHGALVSKGKDGILLMGPSGSGKSTLSAVFLRAGYRYFSDEHPMIQAAEDGVVGKGFPNKIAVPAASLGNFPGAGKRFRYQKTVGKYHAHPRDLLGRLLGDTCRIRKLIFPRFRKNEGLTLKPLSVDQALERLQLDDYYRINRSREERDRLWRTHYALLKRLARGARSFDLLYGPSGIPDIVKAVQKA